MWMIFNLSCTSAYVTHADISRLRDFQEQTVIVVKAPEETKLEVPAPKEVNDQRRNHFRKRNNRTILIKI